MARMVAHCRQRFGGRTDVGEPITSTLNDGVIVNRLSAILTNRIQQSLWQRESGRRAFKLRQVRSAPTALAQFDFSLDASQAVSHCPEQEAKAYPEQRFDDQQFHPAPRGI